MVYAVVC